MNVVYCKLFKMRSLECGILEMYDKEWKKIKLVRYYKEYLKVL